MLNFQADKIEMVLAAHKAPVRVWGGRMNARTIQFHLAPAANVRLDKLEGLTDEVALALGAASARLTRVNGMLSLEIPRTDSKFVSFADLDRRLSSDDAMRRATSHAGTAMLGIDAEGVPLLLRLSSPDVSHCLIAGTTGSGKTELARTLIASLVLHQKPRDIQLALFDPKGHDFASFAQVPHLLFPIAREIAEMGERLNFLVGEMERRERDASTSAQHIMRPRIVVVIDELADVLQTGGKEIESVLTRLVQRGRSAGLSVVACTQKPTASAVGTLMKANFPVRLVGRVASSEDARVAAGIGGTGAEKLAGRGDFLLIAAGQVIRFQAAQIRQEELLRLFGREASYSSELTVNEFSANLVRRLRRVK